MIRILTQSLFWLRRRSFFRVAQRTMVVLMPLATIGAYFQILRNCIFSPDSLIYNLMNFDYVMSDQVWNLGNTVTYSMIQVTFSLFGLYAAYFAAFYTAKIYHKDATMTGITAMIIIGFSASIMQGNVSNGDTSVGLSFNTRFLNINGLIIALLIGYAVGQIFHWLGKDYVHIKFEHTEKIRDRIWTALNPMVVSIILGLLVGLVLYFFKTSLLDSNYLKDLILQYRSSNDVMTVVGLTIMATIAWWCGFGYPLQALMRSNSSGASVVNLNYALLHGSASKVPYKYLGSSLSQGYGLMGDAAIFLVLAVVILLYSNNRQHIRTTKINLLAIAFGSKSGFAVGIPVILNPLYLLPLIIIPAFNELVAASAISAHLIMPTVYPVLAGTPGILVPFLGSNGDWPSLLFTVLLFIIDILIFIPFIMIERRVNEELKAYDQAVEA